MFTSQKCCLKHGREPYSMLFLSDTCICNSFHTIYIYTYQIETETVVRMQRINEWCGMMNIWIYGLMNSVEWWLWWMVWIDNRVDDEISEIMEWNFNWCGKTNGVEWYNIWWAECYFISIFGCRVASCFLDILLCIGICFFSKGRFILFVSFPGRHLFFPNHGLVLLNFLPDGSFAPRMCRHIVDIR